MTTQIDIPAGPHARFSPEAVAGMVGQEFDLDERIAGLTGLVAQSLFADERGLWTRARIVDAEAIRDGEFVRLTIEAA